MSFRPNKNMTLRAFCLALKPDALRIWKCLTLRPGLVTTDAGQVKRDRIDHAITNLYVTACRLDPYRVGHYVLWMDIVQTGVCVWLLWVITR